VSLDVDGTNAAGEWFRHVPAGVDPAGRPDPAGDSRWQRGRVIDALYLADSASGAWAEWYRHLAEASIPPDFALPRDWWRYRLQSLQVADLCGPDRLRRVGLATPRPGRRSWPSFQGVGEQLHEEGWPGLLAPSAARPGSRVLVIFLSEGAIPAELAADGYTRIAEPSAPPTGMQTGSSQMRV
jgi:RES domain-containing protein